jgi:hypothetical protein
VTGKEFNKAGFATERISQLGDRDASEPQRAAYSWRLCCRACSNCAARSDTGRFGALVAQMGGAFAVQLCPVTTHWSARSPSRPWPIHSTARTRREQERARHGRRAAKESALVQRDCAGRGGETAWAFMAAQRISVLNSMFECSLVTRRLNTV